jgi:hypothetical protein
MEDVKLVMGSCVEDLRDCQIVGRWGTRSKEREEKSVAEVAFWIAGGREQWRRNKCRSGVSRGSRVVMLCQKRKRAACSHGGGVRFGCRLWLCGWRASRIGVPGGVVSKGED